MKTGTFRALVALSIGTFASALITASGIGIGTASASTFTTRSSAMSGLTTCTPWLIEHARPCIPAPMPPVHRHHHNRSHSHLCAHGHHH